MVEGHVDVLEEEWNGGYTFEELSWSVILNDLDPVLHLLTVGSLIFVGGTSEREVDWPCAAKLIWILAGLNKVRYIYL